MTIGRTMMRAASVALSLTFAGCGTGRPPAVDRDYEGDIRSSDVARGQHIFLLICNACHAGRVNPRGYHWQPGQMRQQIREGNLYMPPLPEHRLSNRDVEAVLAYLSTIGAIDGDLPATRSAEPPVETPPDEPLIDASLVASDAGVPAALEILDSGIDAGSAPPIDAGAPIDAAAPLDPVDDAGSPSTAPDGGLADALDPP